MKSTRTNLLVGAMLMLMSLTIPSGWCYAAPPQTLTYRGSLANSAGTPISGAQVMVFSIYSAATGGTALWTENQAITVSNGNYSVVLGSATPMNLPFDAQYYLGVKVGMDAEMTPRMPLTSVGYSFNAGNGVPKGGIIMWSGAIADIPAGWALCNGTNGTPDLKDRFVVGAGGGFAVAATGGEASHTLTISEMPSHTHVQNSHDHNVSISNGGTGSLSAGALGSYTGYMQSGAGAAIVTNTTATNQNTGGSQPHNNLPPYYALAFIMRL